MISLEKITADNYKACIDLKVREDQSSFVSPNMLSLAKAYVFYDIVTPLAIYNDDQMVGFMLLKFYEEYRYYFVWQLMIDEKYQGKGYGKQAMRLAIEWMKRDERCGEIVTTYIVGNDSARNLYTKLGFKQMGEDAEDEIDMVLNF